MASPRGIILSAQSQLTKGLKKAVLMIFNHRADGFNHICRGYVLLLDYIYYYSLQSFNKYKMQRLLRCLPFVLLMPLLAFAKTGNHTLEFVENRGQWNGPFLYKSITGGGNVYLEQKGITFQMEAADNSAKIHGVKENHLRAPQTLRFHTYKVNFVNAQTAEVVGSKPQQHYYNYYLGNDKSKWKSGIHPCYTVDYKGIYKGIDLHIASENADMKYDFIVAPGADPQQIALQYEGTDGLRIEAQNLIIKTSVGTLKELKPYAYQYINGERVEVTCKYKLNGNVVSYIFPYGYDNNYALVIDPTVIFSTYTGSTADNWGFTATYDNLGNFYAGGGSSSAGYPTSTGAYSTSYGGGGTCGGEDAFQPDVTITKFNSSGTAIIFSTYLGGNNNDQPHSMVVDGSGNLVVAGRTCSSNFPTTFRAFSSGSEIFVTKFNSTGTALIGSTYMGGSADDGINISADYGVVNSLKHSYGDDARSEVIVDNADNIYVAACTRSADFPLANSSQGSISTGQDAVVFKLNSTVSTLLWSTYLGGNGDDAAYVLSLNKSQTALYVSGGTSSSNFFTTPGTYRTSYGGSIDGFIIKFQNGGAYNRQIGTFVGGSSYDQCYGIQLDNSNNVYVMGQSLNNGVPRVNAAGFTANSSQFILKLDSTLSTTVYATQFGSGTSTATNITPTAFLVDTCENVYVSGWGGTVSGNGSSTTGMPAVLGTPAPALITSTSPTGEDFYFFVLAKNATTQLFGGFFGSPTIGDHVDGGTSRFDKNGVIYQAMCGGCGGSNSVPTTAGVYSNTNRSSNCNVVAFKMELNLGNADANFIATPTKVCVGDPVTITNLSVNATAFEWDFGDGSPTFTGAAPPPKTYAAVGNYTIRLIVRNPVACNLADTHRVTIRVTNDRIDAIFNTTVLDTCFPYRASFANSSVYSPTPAAAVFTWDFGDGTTFTGVNPPNKSYSTAGTYTVRLIMTDSTACNSPDTAIRSIAFRNDSVKAKFLVPDLICYQDSFRVTNRSENVQTYLWSFGDGKTSTQSSPAHKYDTIGTYKVKLIATNMATCNKVDSQSAIITLKPSPTADFTYTPLVPVTNEPHRFTNLSVGAVSYKWSFGDGEGSDQVNPEHTYKRTGEYTVCLVVTNMEGCTDTVCKTILADVKPLADIPNAFSPNGDGNNDILFVRGYGVEKMNLKIYNRWGEIVFENNDINKGWDGTVNGKPQEMEAYGFVLNVTFVDGTTFYKKGNVTLLR
ncbi:hypothetical protein CAP35_03310 [Chitinophagaceae bacterium IBVUCB1]|nr:hypothetical protein CAP35_03310 [Chitinophagaceae bacterium IBVUCB1]